MMMIKNDDVSIKLLFCSHIHTLNIKSKRKKSFEAAPPYLKISGATPERIIKR